jgi:hypothetical protein
LAFRDVEADSGDVAQVLAIGPRGQSRIYKTVDGGKSWDLTFKNAEATAFYDCLAMFPDGVHGLAMSDPVDGKFRVITTDDAGDTWKKVAPSGMPKAKDGEFGFAASGTCVVTAGIKDAWIASGGTAARVFHSTDYGQTWTVASTTIPPNADGGGVFSLAMRTSTTGIAVGRELPRGGQRQADDGADGLTAAPPGPAAATWAVPLRGSRGCRSRRPPSPSGRTAPTSPPTAQDLDPIGKTGFHSCSASHRLHHLLGQRYRRPGRQAGRPPQGVDIASDPGEPGIAPLPAKYRPRSRAIALGVGQLRSGSAGRVECQASSPG